MPPARTTPKPPTDAADAPLKRLGGGRWQTRDERFTIEPQSGTWVVVDAEQTDDLGLPLVRGPYRSLTDAKAAISTARASAPAESPLAERLADRETAGGASGRTRSDSDKGAARKGTQPDSGTRRSAGARDSDRKRRNTGDDGDEHSSAPSAPDATPAKAGARRAKPPAPAEPPEPGWLTDLEPAERGRARRLIARLEEAGIDDAISVVRRDLLGDVPAVAAIAIGRLIADLPDDASAATVAELLADGRDDRLDVRWRLVDGAGRPILIEAKRLARR